MEKKKEFKEKKLNDVSSVRWEELTSAEFPAAVRKSRGVCILPMGVLEKHSEHSALGTDYLQAHYIACLAAEKEFAVVFPPFYFGEVYEAKCFPGVVTIKPSLLVELIQAVFDEIGRNGFKKIIIYNRHGGSVHLLYFLSWSTLWEEKPYYVYFLPSCFPLTPEREKEWKSVCETAIHGHACECETSITLAISPHLVKTNKIPKTPATPLQRLKHLPPGIFTSMSMYSKYPEHYAGDARSATAEKGHKLLQLLIDTLAEYIAAIKSDKVVPTLTKDFYQRVKNLGKMKKHLQ